MGTRVAIAGASGYAGGELLRLLLRHPEFEIGTVTAASNAGAPVTSVHPHLPSLADHTFTATTPEAFAGADAVFLGLPHGESARVASWIPDDVPVVDIGADFRLASAGDWTAYYGTPHAGRWTYGLPELPYGAGKLRDEVARTRRVANPGCYATAVILGIAPLVRDGLVEPGSISVVASSGTSGAGRAAKAHLMGSEVMGQLSTYKAGGAHQHIPEIRQAVAESAGRPAEDVRLSFTPVLAPMPRGILAVTNAVPYAGAAGLRESLTAAYDGEPFVRVLPEGVWPATGATAGSNSVQIQLAYDAGAGRVVIVTAEDNLGKGAAGQALQNANIMLGLDETAGLPLEGVAP
ncbi:MAG TPA: N-acetyl-gamma-glutamyl-phosphate reductase [Streptosporangiaceae bacterium]